MHLKYRNVNDAFTDLVRKFHRRELPIVTMPSRVGEVMMIEEPMTITYTHPHERVLFNQARDCNPMFHLFESLWMLAGRNDVEPLARYNSKIAEIASDDGKTFNGAYGYRWRNNVSLKLGDVNSVLPQGAWWETTDQLSISIDQLKRKPESRRCVLQMWNVEDDLLKIDTTKDVCCNLSAMFSLRTVETQDVDVSMAKDFTGVRKIERVPVRRVLDMTVCNRSNDMIWGMLGANVVHFSFLQEYLAACIGVGVGVYNQFTNNLHCYVERWEPKKWLAEVDNRDMFSPPKVDYDQIAVPFPLVKDPEVFDREVAAFIDNREWEDVYWKEPFLNEVARPMCYAFQLHKEREYDMALLVAKQIASEDWRIAATNWLQTRKTAWEKRYA